MDNINLNQSGIYAITSPSGKRYIGSAASLRKRWNSHRRLLRLGTHHCVGLQSAHEKYGDVLEYSVLILCPKEELIQEEQRHIDRCPRGTLYNSSYTAGSSLGIKRRPETIERMRAANLGKKYSYEVRARMSETRRGRKLSPEAKLRMSAAQKALGKTLSVEHRQKLRALKLGKEMPQETKEKISLTLRGRQVSQQTKKRMGAHQIDKKKPNNKSGYAGVYWRKEACVWEAARRLCGKQVVIGRYESAELANQARTNFVKILNYYDHS